MSETQPRPAPGARDASGPEPEHDILAEIKAEVAQDLADERPPSGGPAYQLVSAAFVLLVVGRHLDDTEKFTRSSLLVAVGAATFVALGVLLPVIGFEIPAVLLGIVWLRFLGGESWRSTIVISVLTTAAFYGLFLYALSVPLPHLIAL